MLKRKTALFGGTFDPIHPGHIIVAGYACEQIGAEKVIFIPAKLSPLKNFVPQVSAKHRLSMIALGILGNDKFEVSDYELTKPAPSFSIDTVRHFQKEYGDNTLLYWLLGADSIRELSHWYKIEELIDECNLSVMYRAGFKKPDFAQFEKAWGKSRVKKLEQNVIKTPLVDISSTEVRKRLTAGQNVDDLLSPNVAQYIRQHNLYIGS